MALGFCTHCETHLGTSLSCAFKGAVPSLGRELTLHSLSLNFPRPSTWPTASTIAMGVHRALPNGSSQRYSDRMSEMFSSGSPEPSNIRNPSSTAGSVDEQSDDEDGATSMDECSDEEDAHGQSAVGTKSVVEYEHQYVKTPNPGYPSDSTSTIIECMAE